MLLEFLLAHAPYLAQLIIDHNIGDVGTVTNTIEKHQRDPPCQKIAEVAAGAC